MRAHLLVLPALVAIPRLASAQGWSGTETSSKSYQQLKAQMKDELRDELKEELKNEIKAELKQEGATTESPKQDTFAEEEWKWEEPVKPELNFLEIDGYFRFRYELFKQLDLGTTYVDTVNGNITGPFSPGYPAPNTLCALDVVDRGQGMAGDPTGYRPAANSCYNKTGHTNTQAGANMRLRIEPIFNVYEDIKIKMQIDVLDNLVLGSTPDAFPGAGFKNPLVPLSAFSRTQLPPSDGINAITDSVRVKRAWAEVGTPLGQLRVGRMPSHFGMGILANEGKGLDSNYGNSADRIMFATKISDFYIVPAFDWVVSGPTSATRIAPQGQPYDRDQRDDVDQFILAVVKRDKDQEIKEKLENDELVLNYGTYQVYRVQGYDAANYFAAADVNQQSANNGPGIQLVKRNARAWIYSAWFKLLWRKLTIEAEFAGIYGKIGNPVIGGSYGASDPSITLVQEGGALHAEYKLLRDALTISFLFAFATGDPSPGWGVRPFSDPAAKPGAWDGSQAINGKNRITNFRFDPDFYVDYIFWRQLVGLVTDAVIFRPGVQYNLTEGLGARLDLVYSRAMFASSTPSASLTLFPGKGDGDANLGIEGDLKIFYRSEDGFNAWLMYAIFIPFAGLNRTVTDQNGQPLELSAGIAHAIQAMIGVTF
jgi:uncharacterized protein (TIGR04551 family)